MSNYQQEFKCDQLLRQMEKAYGTCPQPQTSGTTAPEAEYKENIMLDQAQNQGYGHQAMVPGASQDSVLDDYGKMMANEMAYGADSGAPESPEASGRFSDYGHQNMVPSTSSSQASAQMSYDQTMVPTGMGSGMGSEMSSGMATVPETSTGMPYNPMMTPGLPPGVFPIPGLQSGTGYPDNNGNMGYGQHQMNNKQNGSGVLMLAKNQNQNPTTPDQHQQMYQWQMYQNMMRQQMQQYFMQQQQQYPGCNDSYNLPAPTSLIKVELKNQEVWKEFHSHINEMLVTNRGRELFPRLQFNISGLNPKTLYTMGLKMILLTTNLMKYNSNKKVWEEKSPFLPVPEETNEILTEEKKGSHWMSNGIDLQHAKIFNVGNELKKKTKKEKNKTQRQKKESKEMIEVTSQFKYIPTLSIYEVAPDGINKILVKTVWFDETAFIVVTCYKNEQIKHRKGYMNSYTRGDVKKRAGNELRAMEDLEDFTSSRNTTMSGTSFDSGYDTSMCSTSSGSRRTSSDYQ